MTLPVNDIVKGHANELLGLGTDISANRLKICKRCPIYSPKWGGLCNNNLWIDPDTNEVSTVKQDGYVRGCGCRLLAKTTLPHATCVANKW